MFTRRTFLAASTMPLVFAAPAISRGKLGEDGLYHEDWYLESFLDIAEDIQNAAGKGKRFAILWGLKGCPACKRMHEDHMADSKITDYIRARFEILHLNILGDKEVTDLDGAKRGEKAFSQHYAIRTTPSFQFFPKTADGLAAKEPTRREVARMPGLLEPKAFLAMFRYVAEEGYLRSGFADWLKTNDT